MARAGSTAVAESIGGGAPRSATGGLASQKSMAMTSASGRGGGPVLAVFKDAHRVHPESKRPGTAPAFRGGRGGSSAFKVGGIILIERNEAKYSTSVSCLTASHLALCSDLSEADHRCLIHSISPVFEVLQRGL